MIMNKRIMHHSNSIIKLNCAKFRNTYVFIPFNNFREFSTFFRKNITQ